MTTNNQNSLDDLLNDHDSKVAAFNTKHWDPSQRKVADRWWNEIRSEALAAINKTIMEARVEEAALATEPEITKWRGAETEEEAGYQKGISAQIRLQNRKQEERIAELKKYGRADNE